MKNYILSEKQLSKVVEQIETQPQTSGDKEGSYMAKQQLFTIATMAYKMWEMMEDGQQLEDWIKTLDVSGSVLDIGGSQNPIKGRTKSWDVNEYKILRFFRRRERNL